MQFFSRKKIYFTFYNGGSLLHSNSMFQNWVIILRKRTTPPRKKIKIIPPVWLFVFSNANCSMIECLCSAMHLLIALCDPMLCSKHRARGDATKDNKKQKSQNQGLKDRWVCVNSDSSLALFLGPTCPVQILLCQILPDYSDSKGALADSEHISNSDHFLWSTDFDRVLRLGHPLLFVSLTTPIYMQGKIFPTFEPWT